ncbi:MAG: M24 family metallopeptidase [Lachnospiraceae bacterium]|nr:M24 family metallopeptidase [Lachnospiraceae bacterium]
MLEKIRQLMSENGIDWFLVYSEDAHLSEYTADCDKYREALSGFTGSAGVLVIGWEEAFLFTDSRYHVQAEKQLEKSGIGLMKCGISGIPYPEDFLEDHVWEGQTVALDLKTLSYDRYCKLQKKLPKSVKIIDASRILKESVPDMPARTFNIVEEMPGSSAGKCIEAKLERSRSIIAKKYIKDESYTYILSDLTSIMWLFNLRGNDIRHVPVAYSYAVITAFSATIYINRKMLDADVKAHLEDAGVTLKEYSLFYKDLENIATDVIIADRCKNNALILTECIDKAKFITCHDKDIITKGIKNETEISGMRSAHLKDAVVMIRFIKKVKELAKADKLPDEYELSKMLDDARIQNGCCDVSFDTICAYGTNSAIVHYTAKEDDAAKVYPKGFLLVDSGGHYKFEGTTDITRTISLGELSAEEKKIYTVVLKGNLNLMDAKFPQGYKGALLDGIAEKPLWDNGYFCGHGIGHGVGHYLSVHESEARISRAEYESETPFYPGVIVSDEPGIYIEGKFGVRLENLLLTIGCDDAMGHKMCAFEPLTLVPFDKKAIDLNLLSERELEILRSYNLLIWDRISGLLDDGERQWLKENIDINP